MELFNRKTIFKESYVYCYNAKILKINLLSEIHLRISTAGKHLGTIRINHF